MTKNVGSAGRFGPRYGRRVRKRTAEIEAIEKSKFVCPACSFQKVKRIDAGIWYCSKCKRKFAGGMYQPQRIKEVESSV